VSYHLSLDETADPQRDVVFEDQGLSFVTEARQKHLVQGLKVEVREIYGREGIVAYNSSFEGGGC
jgi:hypothetical protein